MTLRAPIGRVLPLGILALIFIAYVLYALAGIGGGNPTLALSDLLYNSISVGVALCCLARGLLIRGDRAAWIAIGAGLASWAAADVYFTFAFPTPDDIVYPSIADVLYLATYPLFLVGIFLMARSCLQGLGASMWLDGLIGASAVAAVGAAFLYPTLVAGTEGDPTTVAVNLAYPLGDMLLLTFVVFAFAMTRWRPERTWLLLGAGLAIQGVADGLYLYMEATTGYDPRLDFMWLISGITIASGALLSRRAVGTSAGALQMLAMPAVFAGMAVALQVYDHFQRLNELALWLATATLVAAIVRMALSYAENRRLLAASRHEALTDALTGLGNRRRLLRELTEAIEAAREGDGYVFLLFDLDGFKAYNDTFGHPAGDALLQRLGTNLAAAVRPYGSAFRLGGDEFCVLGQAQDVRSESIVAAASAALVEHGEGFHIKSSCGVVRIPQEADEGSAALRLADRRLYAHKGRRPGSPEHQTRNVLLRVLREREPTLGEHLDLVARTAVMLGRAVGLSAEDLDVLARGAELHDIGKMAIPDEVLRKPGPLSELEWQLMRKHTIIGERILSAAPAMIPVARLVRSSHERWDGSGYPDGLSGEEIPLGSRIIAICDAYEAMVEPRSYRAMMNTEEAAAELRACAGSQFDERLVDLFCDGVYTKVEAEIEQAHDSAALVAAPSR